MPSAASHVVTNHVASHVANHDANQVAQGRSLNRGHASCQLRRASLRGTRVRSRSGLGDAAPAAGGEWPDHMHACITCTCMRMHHTRTRA